MEKRKSGSRLSLPAMELSLNTCFVVVNDPDEALAFYRDTLGLEVRNDVANDGSRWITVGAPSQPNVNIVLTNYLDGSPADRDAAILLGDYLYAHGLVRITTLGDVEAVARLAELLSLCAHLRAEGQGGDGEAWAATIASLGVMEPAADAVERALSLHAERVN